MSTTVGWGATIVGERMSESDRTAEIDWAALRTAARAAMRRAYAPYSNFPVGAAGLTAEGRIVTGCNVENASYGLGLCAECGLVSALHATSPAREPLHDHAGEGHPAGPPVPSGDHAAVHAAGPARLVAVAIVDGRGDPLMPCGRCRQLLWEHGGPELPLETAAGPRPLRELLPDAFGPDDLTPRHPRRS